MADIKRYSEIMEGALANMIARQDKITDFNEGGIVHTILDTCARIAERIYVAIRQGYNELLSLIPYSIFHFERKAGLRASGYVIFSRGSPLQTTTAIPKGTRVSGGGRTFTTAATGTIGAGSLESDPVPVLAEVAGSGGNIKAGTVDTIETSVPSDVVEVTNEDAFTGGSDDESDEQFDERFRCYINGLSGTNVYAVKAAALSVDAVRSVAVQNHKPPLNDIYNMSVYVDDGSGGSSEETLEAVRSVIDGDGTEANPGHTAPGINVRVVAPSALPLNIVMTGTCSTEDTATAEADVREAVAGYVNGLVIGKPAILSEIVARVMSLAYVKDIKILSPEENLVPPINQIIRLGECSVTMTEG